MKLGSLAAFAVVSALLAVLAVPAKAHHSFNTFFDMSRTIAIEGVVTSFKLVSPHSEMLVDVPDPGKTGDLAHHRQNGGGQRETRGMESRGIHRQEGQGRRQSDAERRRNGHGCGRGHVRG